MTEIFLEPPGSFPPLLLTVSHADIRIRIARELALFDESRTGNIRHLCLICITGVAQILFVRSKTICRPVMELETTTVVLR